MDAMGMDVGEGAATECVHGHGTRMRVRQPSGGCEQGSITLQ